MTVTGNVEDSRLRVAVQDDVESISYVTVDKAASLVPGAEMVKCNTGSSSVVKARVFNVSSTVRIGGAILAFNAGFVNAVAFLALSAFVSHVTGTWSRVGLGLEDPNVADAGDSVLLVVAFMLGSSTCGLLIAHDTIHLGLALYDFGLIIESCLLIVTTFTAHLRVARYLACAACGLQNGMATHWGGAVIRTTHVTGLFTDAGLLTGRLLSMLARKRCGRNFDAIDHVDAADDLSKLSVLVTIAISFLLGVAGGTHMFNRMEHHAFLIPATITGTLGLMYAFFRIFVLGQRIFSDAEMDIVDLSAGDVIYKNASDASCIAFGCFSDVIKHEKVEVDGDTTSTITAGQSSGSVEVDPWSPGGGRAGIRNVLKSTLGGPQDVQVDLYSPSSPSRRRTDVVSLSRADALAANAQHFNV
jgi:uncharacterized membrane protein YoaK (UPF0700 family)